MRDIVWCGDSEALFINQTEKFMSKAPEAKINEEKAKLEKYQAMMSKVEEELAAL